MTPKMRDAIELYSDGDTRRVSLVCAYRRERTVTEGSLMLLFVEKACRVGGLVEHCFHPGSLSPPLGNADESRQLISDSTRPAVSGDVDDFN